MKLASLLLILASGIWSPASAAESRPNVIVLLADDLGYADMSFLPQSPDDIATPNIDRLAKSGTYYKEAYATAPICSPSRVGLITGRYQQRWGNYWYGQGGLPDNEITIPQILKPLGYATKKIGKTHNNGGTANHPLDHGFDEYLGFLHHTWDYLRISADDAAAYNARRKGAAKAACIGPLVRDRDTPVSFEDTYTTEVFADEAVEFLQRKHDKPFYLHVSSLDVLPTIADLTGATKPAKLDGHSLAPTFKGESPAEKPLHWDSGKGEWVVRKGPWKLVQSKGWNHTTYQLDPKGKATTAPNSLYPKGLLLFNLDKDIGETTDLAAQNPEIVTSLTKLHDDWRAQMGKPVRGTKKKQ